MRIEMITTGEELLDGRVINTNSHFIADQLSQLGLFLARDTTTGDLPEELSQLINERAMACDILLITGGIGPTDDDRTSACVADAMKVSFIKHQDVLDNIKASYAAQGLSYPSSNDKQAYFPEGAEILSNNLGTAPGFCLQTAKAMIVVMPGVPFEMKEMFHKHVKPRIQRLASALPSITLTKTLRCAGVGESSLADAIAEIYPLMPGIDMGYRARLGEVHLQIWATAATKAEASQIQTQFLDKLLPLIKPWVYDGNYPSFAAYILDLLRQKKQGMALAESCTGGALAKLFTDESGASDVFIESAVTYSNDAKQRRLGVSEALLATHGAVSAACAKAMAEGIVQTSGADIGLAITGVAGPNGGSKDKPVGTVFIACHYQGETIVNEYHFPGSRERVRLRSVSRAMVMLVTLLRTA